MKTKKLFTEDSYQKEAEVKVIAVKDGKFVTFDKTIFYPNSGGQPYDTGEIIRKSDNKKYKLVFAGIFGGEISNEVHNEDDSTPIDLKEGDEVIQKLNWERRYKLMRVHTAAHVLCAVIDKDLGTEEHPIKFTGSQLEEEKSRFDINMQEYDREKMIACVNKANEIIQQGKEVIIETKPKQEALKDPEVVKLAKGFDESIKEVRLVTIKDFDLQPCGGTHLKDIKEIGKIVFLKTDNKGKGNRRLYYTVE